MSADLLARNCVRVLKAIREEKTKALRRCKPRPPTEVNGTMIPAASCEEIALYAVDTNATVDAFNLAIDTIESEYKKIVSPEQPDDEPTKARDIY
jgi:hypothetical protein